MLKGVTSGEIRAFYDVVLPVSVTKLQVMFNSGSGDHFCLIMFESFSRPEQPNSLCLRGGLVNRWCC